MPRMKIRIKVTNQSLGKAVSLIASGALLASNFFRVSAGISDNLRDNRRQRIRANLQGAADVTASLASLASVISDTLEKHRATPG